MADSVSWPLAGLRVLDLSSEIAGPYATKLLADAGADVIKIESPEGGDPLRRWSASKSEIPAGQDGALFRYLNTSKRSVILNLAEAGDRDALLELAVGADLVVESFEPGTLDRLGLGFDELRAKNPRLSLVSITPCSTVSRTVISSISSGSCGKKPIRIPGWGRASPSKSLSTPAMIRSTVDLPAPLSPSTPILAPGKKDNEMSLMIVRLGGTVLLTPIMV